MVNIDEIVPKWQKEISSFSGIKSTFIIEGNINDIYPTFPTDEQGNPVRVDFCSLNRAIVNIFDSGKTQDLYDFLFCDPLFGFADPLHFNNTIGTVSRCEKQVTDELNLTKNLNGSEKRNSHGKSKATKTSEIIRMALTQADNDCPEEERKSIAVVVNFASHYLSSPEGMSVDETSLFLNLIYASNNAIQGNRYINTLILVVDKINDIPAWFFLNNPNVRTISLPSPDRFIREAYICKYFKEFNDSSDTNLVKLRNKFIDLTDGMKVLELSNLRRLRAKMNIPIEEIADIVSIYKYGFKDNQWERIRNKIGKDIKERIEERVKGQDEAVNKIIRVIKRSVSGLSGMQHSSDSSKPRGILFLAGPTGTGKTEIVKTVTELLFEDEKRLIRFDMSEYTAEHSDQKLFGAPPGYVGYDNGGQLTNAVKNNPFSILLFDEIEKAHPNIMDKFLQILEDGRMTDGQGNTVYFSETLIFFTSNLGIQKEVKDPSTGCVIGRVNIVQPGEPYEEIEKKVKAAIGGSFKAEVVNRLGENIIVFNYIDEDASIKIATSKIDKINKNVMKKNKIIVSILPEAMNILFDLCWKEKPRLNGGRGIGNVIEEHYLNHLAEFIFDYCCQTGDKITVGVNEGNLMFAKEE